MLTASLCNLQSFLFSFHNNISEQHNWNANCWIKCLKGGISWGLVENKKPIEEWRRTTLFQEGRTWLPTTPWLSLVDGSFVWTLQTFRESYTHICPQSADKRQPSSLTIITVTMITAGEFEAGVVSKVWQENYLRKVWWAQLDSDIDIFYGSGWSISTFQQHLCQNWLLNTPLVSVKFTGFIHFGYKQLQSEQGVPWHLLKVHLFPRNVCFQDSIFAGFAFLLKVTSESCIILNVT